MEGEWLRYLHKQPLFLTGQGTCSSFSTLFWTEDGAEANNRYLNYSRSFYEFMTPYVSSFPREAFLNYRDIDIGAKNPSTSNNLVDSLKYASKLFKENVERLLIVKTRVDPSNFFSYEQSIPTQN